MASEATLCGVQCRGDWGGPVKNSPQGNRKLSSTDKSCPGAMGSLFSVSHPSGRKEGDSAAVTGFKGKAVGRPEGAPAGLAAFNGGAGAARGVLKRQG